MLEDITLQDGETEKDLTHFMNNVEYYEKRRIEGGRPDPENGYYQVVKRAIWTTFKWDILWASFLSFIADLFAIGFTTFIIVLIRFIKAPNTDIWTGVGYSAIFGTLMFLMGICRNQYMFAGMRLGVRIRKTLISSMYNKISKLSMKSLTRTNSGKLVTIVSGDIQAVERPLGITP